MFKDNLIHLRKVQNLTQEEVAEKAGVSRQAVAKWECGETVPDIEKCRLLAEMPGVSQYLSRRMPTSPTAVWYGVRYPV